VSSIAKSYAVGNRSFNGCNLPLRLFLVDSCEPHHTSRSQIGSKQQRWALSECFLGVCMLKMILIVVATAVLAFAAGIWAESTMASHHLAKANAVKAPSDTSATSTPTISPHEMHLKVKPNDLPVQYMQGDFN
jgi:hypothetical protein